MWEPTFHEEDEASRGLSLYLLDTARCTAQGQEARNNGRTLGRQTGTDEGLGSGVMSWLEIWLYYVQKCDLRQDCTGCTRWESIWTWKEQVTMSEVTDYEWLI